MKFLQVKIQKSHMFLLLEDESLPIEITGIQRLVDYTLTLGYKKNLPLLPKTYPESQEIRVKKCEPIIFAL